VPGQYQLEEVSAAQLKALPAAFAQHRDQRVKQRQQTNKLRAALALTPVGKLTTHAFRELCNAMVSEGLTGGTIRLEFALLRHCFNQAIKEWHWSTLSNPLDGFKLPRANPPRDRRLTAEEATRLDIALDDCRNPWVKPYIGLAIETTMRRSEILLTATWADVHLEQRFIYLRDTKNGAPQKVPLTKRALEILAALPRAAGQEQVFPLTTDALDKAWKRALRRADIHDMHIHDLRHEGTSRLALRLNGNIFLLKQVTGHKSTKMLERYVNVGLNDVLAEFDKTEPPAVVEPPPATGPEPEQVASLPANVVAFKPRDSAVADTLINPARSTS
jgi:site-specific recombinase XerC